MVSEEAACNLSPEIEFSYLSQSPSSPGLVVLCWHGPGRENTLSELRIPPGGSLPLAENVGDTKS